MAIRSPGFISASPERLRPLRCRARAVRLRCARVRARSSQPDVLLRLGRTCEAL